MNKFRFSTNLQINQNLAMENGKMKCESYVNLYIVTKVKTKDNVY